MHGALLAFNGLVRTLLVRRGVEEKLPNKSNVHQAVYSEMFLQVCRDYSGLPDPRTLKGFEIRFFYDALRPELREHTRPNKVK